MQHDVATCPMFIDVEVMNADTRLVLEGQDTQTNPSDVARGLSSLYKEITSSKHNGFPKLNIKFVNRINESIWICCRYCS